MDYEPLPAIIDVRAAIDAGRAAAARSRHPATSVFAGRAGTRRRCSRIRRRGARGLDRAHQQSPDRRRHRAARRPRVAGNGPREAHALEFDPDAASHPAHGGRAARRAGKRHAGDRARCRRRLRLQGQALSGRIHRPVRGAHPAVARCAGSRPGARASSPTTRGAIISPSAELALDAQGPLSGAARAHARQPRRLRVDLRRRHPERDLQRAARRRLSHTGDLMSKVSASSPTRSRPMPIAAPVGRKPATCSSASPTAPPTNSRIDRAEIRRRNLVPPTAMPYKTPIGPTYDSGDFPKLFARVLALGNVCRVRTTPHTRQEARPDARLRHGVLRRILRRRADALCRCARCPRRIL